MASRVDLEDRPAGLMNPMSLIFDRSTSELGDVALLGKFPKKKTCAAANQGTPVTACCHTPCFSPQIWYINPQAGIRHMLLHLSALAIFCILVMRKSTT
jgi:hypothetical protein